jgi:hypothetical protein
MRAAVHVHVHVHDHDHVHDGGLCLPARAEGCAFDGYATRVRYASETSAKRRLRERRSASVASGLREASSTSIQSFAVRARLQR